jgi:hypothetical protein
MPPLDETCCPPELFVHVPPKVPWVERKGGPFFTDMYVCYQHNQG